MRRFPFPLVRLRPATPSVCRSRPTSSIGDYGQVAGYCHGRRAGRAQEDGGFVRYGRIAMGNSFGGGPGHASGNLRLFRESCFCFVSFHSAASLSSSFFAQADAVWGPLGDARWSVSILSLLSWFLFHLLVKNTSSFVSCNCRPQVSSLRREARQVAVAQIAPTHGSSRWWSVVVWKGGFCCFLISRIQVQQCTAPWCSSLVPLHGACDHVYTTTFTARRNMLDQNVLSFALLIVYEYARKD